MTVGTATKCELHGGRDYQGAQRSQALREQQLHDPLNRDLRLREQGLVELKEAFRVHVETRERCSRLLWASGWSSATRRFRSGLHAVVALVLKIFVIVIVIVQKY